MLSAKMNRPLLQTTEEIIISTLACPTIKKITLSKDREVRTKKIIAKMVIWQQFFFTVDLNPALGSNFKIIILTRYLKIHYTMAM